MLFDTHMHTVFSTDSKMTISEAIKQAKELKIGITITEHMDLCYPDPELFLFDVDEYFKTYCQYNNDKVLLGIEIGLRPDCCEDNKKIVTQHPFDLVIGSVHVVDHIDLYSEHFYRNRTKKDVYTRYFEYMLDCVKQYDYIDTLGHIDYICRYARYQDTQLYYNDFKEYIDPVLALLASRGQALELNTRRFDQEQNIQCLLPIYSRFKELKGEWVTIGSDAHNMQDIGKSIKEAVEFAERCRLQAVYFKNRQRMILS